MLSEMCAKERKSNGAVSGYWDGKFIFQFPGSQEM